MANRHLKKILISFLAVSLLLSPLLTSATDFSSSNFIVKDPVIKPGAGFATSSNYGLWSSFGQEAIGTSSASNFGLKAGFLYFLGPTPTAPPSGYVLPISAGAGPGPSILPLPKPFKGQVCDFNNDNKCNIIDFSILLAYFNKPVTELTARYDMNADNKIDVIEVSILLYYWI